MPSEIAGGQNQDSTNIVADSISNSLTFLYDRINYESTSPAANREFKLGRMRKLARLLGDPQNSQKIIHIAGTKGKGSTSQMVASALEQAGHTVGIFSSPHLIKVNERFSINGNSCTDTELYDLINRIQPVVAQMDDDPDFAGVTFFEITTAIALLHFQDRNVDVSILEVGLGGRLDSTNICNPVITAITNIGLDHTQLLGDSIEAIAVEKAGIIKSGIPTVCGSSNPVASSTIGQIANDRGAPVVQRGIDFDVIVENGSNKKSISVNLVDKFQWDDVQLRLAGEHQFENAASAAAICWKLHELGWPVTAQHIKDGISQATVRGRMEVISKAPTILMDVAHNRDSIEALLKHVTSAYSGTRKHLLISISQDKQHNRIVESVLPIFDTVVFTTYRSNARGVNSLNLLKDVESEQQHHAFATMPTRSQPVCIDPPATALRYLTDLANSEDLICITGSFFLVGEIMDAMQSVD
ncbi:MAG: bifunctional folylpolyglutamate synthase/dihydrofolate synthase [Pirellulaceae bacterium]